jgi:ubiquinone/menaquinone biosynthesis C-methylase UbiE
MKKNPNKQLATSWQPISKWYSDAVGKEGHYYHQHVVLPGALKLLQLSKESSLLDLACGQGILARSIPKTIIYTGVDIAPSLIQEAKKLDTNPAHRYCVGDITRPLPIDNALFSHTAILLALQNIETPLLALQNASKHLQPQGRLLLVLNHPCFRIPRQSSWQVDQEKKIQYRRMDRYLSPLKIPIQAHPSKGEKSTTTWSFHHPLSAYCQWLNEAGLRIVTMEEWCSDKVSEGGAAKMENRSREEFPLFLAILCEKL